MHIYIYTYIYVYTPTCMRRLGVETNRVIIFDAWPEKPRLVVYYLQVREEPLLPPVEDFQVPILFEIEIANFGEGFWGGVGGQGGDCWLIVGDCGFDNKKLLIFPVTLEKTHIVFQGFLWEMAATSTTQSEPTCQIGDI